MRRYGLIGLPLSHSFSKKYFTEKFANEGIADAVYELYPIEKITRLQDLLQANQDLLGFNVTIPYKESVLPLCNHLSDSARAVGAVNCIKLQNGELCGYNTDIIGFEKSLQPLLQQQHSKALILGSGGASKAVQFVLKRLGIYYKVVSRIQHKDYLRYEDLTSDVVNAHKLIIHTTPLGMYPDTDEKPPLNYSAIAEGHLLYDLIYNPAETTFLALGKAHGARIKNGLEMLEIQAEESWKIWNT